MASAYFQQMLAIIAAGGGVAPIVIDPAADFFFDDFDGTNASLTGRSGWNVVGDAGKAAGIGANAGIARMLGGYNGESPWGYQLTGDVGTSKFVEFEYDYTQQGAAIDDPATPLKYYDQTYILAWSDANNYTYATMESRVDGWRMDIRSVIAGSADLAARYNALPNTAQVRIKITDRFRVWINGAVWVPDQLFNDASASYPDRLIGGSVIKAGGFGFRHSFHPVMFSKFARVNPVDLTIADPERGYGRASNGARAIEFSGTYVGTPVSWAWRLRSAETGDQVTAWAAFSPVASSGAWSDTLTAPTGVHLLDVAWIDGAGKAHVATSSEFSVGALIMFYGQSNAAGSGDSQNAWTTASDPMVNGWCTTIAYSGSSYARCWSDSDQGVEVYMPNCAGLAKSLSAAAGIPVIVIAVGVPATELALLKPGTTNWNTKLIPAVALAGGNVEQWVVSQGEAEALSASSYAAYAADFAATVAGFRDIGGRSDAGVYLRLIGEDTAVAVNSTTTTRAANFRALQMTLENPSDKIWVASHPLGVPLTDNIHFTALGHIEMCRREGLTIARRAYGALAYDGRGPVVTGATRAGAVITLAVDLNGATGISGSALTGYTVSADNFTTALTISSVNVSGSTIVITLAADPGGPVKVGSYREASYNNSSIAIGAYADGTTIPVMPIAAPVTTTS